MELEKKIVILSVSIALILILSVVSVKYVGNSVKDTTPPITVITTLNGETEFNVGEQVNIRCDATDDTELEFVKLSINNNNLCTAKDSCSTKYDATIDGQKIFNCDATDTSNNTASSTLTIKILAPPVVEQEPEKTEKIQEDVLNTTETNVTNNSPFWVIEPTDKIINEDSNLTYQLNASDLDNETLYYSVTGINSTVNSQGLLIFTPDKDWFGTADLEIGVTDNKDNLTSSIEVEVVNINDKPIANAGNDIAGFNNQTITLNGSANDVDNDNNNNLAYTWTQLKGTGITLNNANTARPTFSPTNATTYIFSLTINDGSATSDPDNVTIIVASVIIPSCTENWACTDWGICQQSNNQTRNCIDINNCGTLVNKSASIQDCIYENPDNNQTTNITSENLITGNVIGTNTNPDSKLKVYTILFVLFMFLSVGAIIYQLIYGHKNI